MTSSTSQITIQAITMAPMSVDGFSPLPIEHLGLEHFVLSYSYTGCQYNIQYMYKNTNILIYYSIYIYVFNVILH